MPYTSPATGHNPTTGNAIPASWGDDVNTALDFLATNFPHCSILESTAQSVADSTEADLTSDEENSDIGGMHSTVSNTARITIPASEGGLYFISAVVRFAADADGYRVLAFRKNNTTNYDVQTLPSAGGAVTTTLSGSRSLVLSAGDYVTCRVYHTAGAATNVEMLDFTVQWRATA